MPSAALKSETGKIGFIGGVENDADQEVRGRLRRGRRAVNPDIEVEVDYITLGADFDRLHRPGSRQGESPRGDVRQRSIDIIYAAAGQSGGGMFAAASDFSDTSGSKVWGIGVDSDQYTTVDPELPDDVATSSRRC